MAKKPVEIMLPINADRATPPPVVAQMAQVIKLSAVVDFFHIWDQN